MPRKTLSPLSARPAVGPTSVPSDRRSRARLRDLCDEVLASFRVASDRDLFTEHDRAEGKALLASVLR
jgi:hypothetical protein